MTDGGVWKYSKGELEKLDDGDDVTSMERDPLPHTKFHLDDPIPQPNRQQRQTKGIVLYS